MNDEFFSVKNAPESVPVNTPLNNPIKATSGIKQFRIKDLLTADICLKADITHQRLYRGNIPFVFAKRAIKCHSDIGLKESHLHILTLKRLSPKQDMRLNFTQSNLQ